MSQVNLRQVQKLLELTRKNYDHFKWFTCSEDFLGEKLNMIFNEVKEIPCSVKGAFQFQIKNNDDYIYIVGTKRNFMKLKLVDFIVDTMLDRDYHKGIITKGFSDTNSIHERGDLFNYLCSKMTNPENGHCIELVDLIVNG